MPKKYFNQLGRLRIIFKLLVLLIVVFGFSSSAVHAITRGYQSDDTGVKPGMVVSLSSSGTADIPKVERADKDNRQGVIGIAVDPGDSLVTVASGEEHVYVETDGEVTAYATDLNGEVKEGDLLGLSPLKGVLMKVSSADPALAIALENFSIESGQEYEVRREDGSTKTVKVSLGRVNLDQKAINNLVITRSDSSLERLGRAITGRDVGEIRVAIAMIIFLIVMVAEGGIVYGAISSAILSLGRNPLAKQIIRKELVRVLLVVLAVLGFGAVSIYSILWV